MDRSKQIRPDMNYYYTMQDKGPMYGGAPMPGIGGPLGTSSMQSPLSSLGYGPPQQSSINPQPSNQTSPLSQHAAPSGYTSAMQGPTNPAYHPSVTYGQSPYASQAAMYQSSLAYPQATMAAQNSAAAYMAAAAGAQSAGSPYGFATAPGPLYYPSQPMYASPSTMPASMHPHMQQSMTPTMPPGYHSSISGLSAAAPRPTMSAYPASSPFVRLP